MQNNFAAVVRSKAFTNLPQPLIVEITQKMVENVKIK
jgi:hypothetical protein